MNDWEKEVRQKAREGTLTKDDMREIIQHFAAGRQSAMFASAKTRGKKKSVEEDALTDDFWEGLGTSPEPENEFEGL